MTQLKERVAVAPGAVALARRTGILPWCVLAGALLVTVLLYLLTDAWARRDAELAFARQVNELHWEITARLAAYEHTVRAAAAHLSTSGLVSARDWALYVDHLDVQRLFPGIQALAFASVVTNGDLPRFVAQVRSRDYPDYAVWPDGERPVYVANRLSAPDSPSNLRALGYDLLQEPVRRTAIENARDKAQPTITSRVVLKIDENTSSQGSVILFYPVYRQGAAVDTVEHRREALRGVVLSPLRLKALLSNFSGASAGIVPYAVYDGRADDPAGLLFASGPGAAESGAPSDATRELPFGNRTWTVRYANPQTGARPFTSSLAALLGGLLFSATVFVCTVKLAAARDRANRTLEDLRRTQGDLIRSEKLAALGGLVAGVAHEINSPLGNALTSVTHFSDTVEQLCHASMAGRLKRAEFDECLTRLGEASQLATANILRAAGLVQSFKRIATDQFSESAGRVDDVKAYVEELLLTLKPSLGKAGHSVAVQGDEGIAINTYPGVLGQIIVNLAVNSVDHAWPEGRAGRIVITVRDLDATDVEILYADDGRGVPQGLHEKVFEPFFTTRRDAGNTGLGLHIVHNLVTGKLRGRIALEHPPAGGVHFRMRFPRDILTDGQAPADAGPAVPSSGSVHRPPPPQRASSGS